MVYKICLVSTHGTGKTSLAASIEGELKRRSVEAKYLGEIATKAKERGLPINQETTLEAQLWIILSQFREELFYSQKRLTPPNYQVLICDRGPDNYCYLKHNLKQDDQYALDITLGHIKKFPYSQTYLLPIINHALPAGSGTRDLDLDFRLHMDTEIRTFLATYNIAHLELPPPNPKDNFRQEWIKIIVNNTLKDLQKSSEIYIP